MRTTRGFSGVTAAVLMVLAGCGSHVDAIKMSVGSSQKVTAQSTGGSAVLKVTAIRRLGLLHNTSTGEGSWYTDTDALPNSPNYIVVDISASGTSGQYPLAVSDWKVVSGSYTYEANTTERMPKRLVDRYQLTAGNSVSYVVGFAAPEGSYQVLYTMPGTATVFEWEFTG